MRLIPAIDLLGGQVVRLAQGDYDRRTRYETDPLEQARIFEAAGARCLHVVDLDAARDGGDANLPIIRRLCRETGLSIQTGGGVRNRADLDKRLNAGAGRVVLGSLCVREPSLVGRWLGQLGPDPIVAGLDVRSSRSGHWIPQAAGWTEAGDRDLNGLLAELTDAGLTRLLCTDIDRDGMLSGAAVELYHALAKAWPGLEIQASGGIGKPDDLEAVAGTGVAGCIVGRALLEGAVPLAAIQRWSS